MKINILSNVCAVFLVFAHFLTLVPLSYAQNTHPPSPIDGLRFDTPIPASYGKKSTALYFLSSYDIKKNNILTVKKSIPTPLSVTSTSSSSITELLAPTVTTQKSSPSTLSSLHESTESELLAALPVEELVLEIAPSPSVKPTVEPTVIPTLKPTSAPTAKPVETSSPTPAPTAVPSSAPETNSGGLSADRIFELVNNYRASKSLPPVQKDERVCEVARSRAPEVGAEISGGYMHKGIRARNLPYFNSEIIISMRSEEAAVNWWISDYIHRVQMEGDYKYSCAACSGNSCVQEFTNFVPKG